MYTYFAIFLISILPNQSDHIKLINGDQITGKVQKLEDGKLYFNSDLAGTLTIDIANIRSLSTNQPVKIVLKDDTVLNRRIDAIENGKIIFTSDKTQRLPLTEIAAINPQPKQPPKWKGSISVGVTSTHGNTNSQTTQASAKAALRKEKDRTTINADFGRSKSEDESTGKESTTEDWWKTKAKYDYFITKKFFTFIEGRYEVDKIADLDRRTVTAIGAGYQWIESEKTNFSTEAGIAYLTEKFQNSQSNNETSAQAAYHFDTKINSTFSFINDLAYYPSFGRFSDYYLTATAELRANITENFFTNYKTIFDYDSTPAQGQGNTDVKHILGIGWNF